jgi:uncharacterized RmlC-like cupin family protein
MATPTDRQRRLTASPDRRSAPMGGVVRVRPAAALANRQHLSDPIGISRATVGATGLSLHLVVVPPGGAAAPHRHRGYETAIYCLQGRVETRHGEGLAQSVIIEAGDFLYIGPDVPHQPINLSMTEPAIAIVARDDADEQEHIEPYVVAG